MSISFIHAAAVKKQRGFTLIEVLIAMAITAIVAIISYSGLDSAMKLADSAEAETDRIQKMNRVFDIIGKDFRQIISRPVRSPSGEETEGALVLNESAEPVLKFSRIGWTNPQPSRFQRSQLQRVSYHFDGDKLIRYSWQMMDRYEDSTAQEIVLLHEVKSFQVRVMSEDATINQSGQAIAGDEGKWIDVWPINNPLSPDATLTSLPIAVEITLEIEGWGKIRRIFELVSAP